MSRYFQVGVKVQTPHMTSTGTMTGKDEYLSPYLIFSDITLARVFGVSFYSLSRVEDYKLE